ncbi:MAG: aldo/keto reductase [Armatimonadetes bacterium]|nr:aldo/keto reductase [Armatimonadota bacterium]
MDPVTVHLSQLPPRRFGRLGWMIRPIGLGGAWLKGRAGEPVDGDKAAQLVVDAVAFGVDYIDTSIRYGESEVYIGAALRQIPREQWPRIATKSQVIPEGLPTADGVYQSCLNSLKRLGIERVDLMQIHEVECYGFERIMQPGGALEGLRRCQTEGLCEGIGVTGRPTDLLAQLVDTGEFDATLSYFEYDLATSAATHDLLPACERHDAGFVAGSPARMGMFAGDGLLTHWDHQPEPVRRMRPELERIFGRPVGQMADLSVRFLYSDPRVHNINIGSSRMGSLISSAQAALAGPLPPAQLNEVRRLHGWQGPGQA